MQSCAQVTAASTATTAAIAAASPAPPALPPPASVGVGERGVGERGVGGCPRPGSCCLVERSCRVPHDRTRLFERHQHAGAHVLDALELPDRPAELLTNLGVLRGGGHAPAGDARRFRAEQHRGKIEHVGAGQPVEHPIRRHGYVVRLDPADAAYRIHARQLGNGQLRGVHGDPFFAGVRRDRQHDDICDRGPEDGFGSTADHQAVVTAPAGEARRRRGAARGAGGAAGEERSDPGAVREAGQQLVTRLDRAGSKECGAGQDRRQNRPGRGAGAKLLQGDNQLDQAGALAAVLFGDVQAEHSLACQGLPEGREGGLRLARRAPT